MTCHCLRIVAPPVTHCLLCKEELKVHHKPTQISVFTLDGPEIFSKYILRCRDCRLCPKEVFDSANENARQDVWYHPEKVSKHYTYIF